MKNFKIKRTLVDGADNKSEEYLNGIFHDTLECGRQIRKALKAAYGDEWEELHGDDIDIDKNGFPHYYFDMGDGDYEEYSVEDVGANVTITLPFSMLADIREYLKTCYCDSNAEKDGKDIVESDRKIAGYINRLAKELGIEDDFPNK